MQLPDAESSSSHRAVLVPPHAQLSCPPACLPPASWTLTNPPHYYFDFAHLLRGPQQHPAPCPAPAPARHRQDPLCTMAPLELLSAPPWPLQLKPPALPSTHCLIPPPCSPHARSPQSIPQTSTGVPPCPARPTSAPPAPEPPTPPAPAPSSSRGADGTPEVVRLPSPPPLLPMLLSRWKLRLTCSAMVLSEDCRLQQTSTDHELSAGGFTWHGTGGGGAQEHEAAACMCVACAVQAVDLSLPSPREGVKSAPRTLASALLFAPYTAIDISYHALHSPRPTALVT